MARVCKSLVAPEQGYAHRDHRSKKGRTPNAPMARHRRIWEAKREKRMQKLERQNDLEGIEESLSNMPLFQEDEEDEDE